MSTPLPSKISRDSFKKTLAGRQGYISSAQTKALKQAGLSGILSKKNVTRAEALKAVKTLQDQGQLSKLKSASDLYNQAARGERRQLEIKEGIKQGHLRGFLAMDVSEQLQREELENDFIKYPKRSFSSVAEKVEYENKLRAAKVAEEKEKRSKLFNSQVKPATPIVVTPPDMIID
ncbi:MAG: hypothetical protein WCX71_03705 [Candidatus Buchananbacteria bacterium]